MRNTKASPTRSRTPAPRRPIQRQTKSIPRQHHGGHKLFILAVVLVVAALAYISLNARAVQAPSTKHNSAKTTVASTPAATPPVNHCSGNTLSQLVLVSISDRHLWACDASEQVYDSAVVTGMAFLPADLTPTGTYHVYAKETDVYLKGSDSTGSWDDYVYYWMPFLENQYGIYGFHDATWRAPSAFGNISPNSTNASHGCVETPLATAKWLYNWSQIGTTVTIES